METIKMSGRIILLMNIKALSGLHIGGSSSGLEIGGVDNPVIRDAVSQQPYIPGSSLKGKMRSQLEKFMGLRQNNTMGNRVTIHTCNTQADYADCDLCQIFGVPGEVDATGPTRLVVRDVRMTDHSVSALQNAQTDLAYTELKTEVSIDRVTSAASPRNIERVPAGTDFGPAEMVFTLYSKEDLKLFKHILEGLQLLEDDYLGGSGSRGSGKIAFTDIKLTGRNRKDYNQPIVLGQYDSLQAFSQAYENLDFTPLFEE
ncbi:MAG: type III-A CRISPR-associated RAMP protein Csm3 [Anaerolineae bacterium]|nr:type III-A CRISPR-associated RAMP protein Csm3 [Anaerolineae bacterium]